MTTFGRATFKIKSWDEKPYLEPQSGGKLCRASVIRSLAGDVEGEGAIEYLLAYGADGSCTFVGMEHVIGRVGDRSGSFVLQHGGKIEIGVVQTHWSVVAGSGTGGLRGLRGQGGFASGHQESYPMTLDYEFD
jgi:hypothetical protein